MIRYNVHIKTIRLFQPDIVFLNNHAIKGEKQHILILIDKKYPDLLMICVPRQS